MFNSSSFLLLNLFEVKINAKFELEVGLSEIISINDLAFSSKNVDKLTGGKISW